MSTAAQAIDKRLVDKIAAETHIARSTVTLIQQQIAAIITNASDAGVPPTVLALITGDEIRRQLEAPVREGFATPDEGLASLLNREGGCVDVTEATALFRKPEPVTRQAITEQIRRGEIIAYRTGGGQYRIPRWQFLPEGGVIQGLSEAHEALRVAEGKAYSQLSPFAFFLQAHPLTDGRPPLDALRAGDFASVLRAAESEAE